jgi:hypothetical protein
MRWFHRFSKIFFVDRRFRDGVAVDEAVVRMHGLRVYACLGRYYAIEVVKSHRTPPLHRPHISHLLFTFTDPRIPYMTPILRTQYREGPLIV